jgi:short-subunit dehydrogenase
MSDRTFHDNVVIITGASSGIGAEMALQLADQGAKLSLAARNSEKLEQVAEQCHKRGGEAITVQTNVAESAQCEALIKQTVEAYGRIDTLVNNAGINMLGRFDEVQDLAIFERIMQVNFFGSLYCTYYALPHLKQTEGRVVFINSAAGKGGIPERSAYAPSKHALTGFADTLRIELAGTGVTITSVYPGFVATGMHERNIGPDGKPFGKNHRVDYNTATTTEDAVRRIIKAMTKRKRDDLMIFRLKVGQWLRLIAPTLTDNIARRAIESGR